VDGGTGADLPDVPPGGVAHDQADRFAAVENVLEDLVADSAGRKSKLYCTVYFVEGKSYGKAR
jgi:hypothetical protein